MWALHQKIKIWINSEDQGALPEYMYRWSFVGYTPVQADADNWANSTPGAAINEIATVDAFVSVVLEPVV